MKRPILKQQRILHVRNAAVLWGVILLFLGLLFGGPMTAMKLPWLVLILFLLFQLRTAYTNVHPQRLFIVRTPRPADVNLQAEEVTFPSRDGLELGGWYIPGRRRAAVILVHGLGGSGGSMVLHAEALAASGYALLLLDLRTHGRSQGTLSTFGISEANDVLGALDYLRSRPEIDPEQIGALGISLGAQAILRAAIRSQGLRALVLEGLRQVSLEDHPDQPRTLVRQMYMPLNALMYAMENWLAGITEPEGTAMALRRMKRPVLLISTGQGLEQAFNRLFKDAAGSKATLWELPQATHGAAFYFDRAGYRARVTRFFDQVFGPDESSSGEPLPNPQEAVADVQA